MTSTTWRPRWTASSPTDGPPSRGHVSTRSELDAYEWACWGSPAAWALDHPAEPDAAQVLETANAQRSQWLHGYRDSFGFLCLVLRQTPVTAGK